MSGTKFPNFAENLKRNEDFFFLFVNHMKVLGKSLEKVSRHHCFDHSVEEGEGYQICPPPTNAAGCCAKNIGYLNESFTQRIGY